MEEFDRSDGRARVDQTKTTNLGDRPLLEPITHRLVAASGHFDARLQRTRVRRLLLSEGETSASPHVSADQHYRDQNDPDRNQ
jgi:hypothetical protein